MAIVLAASPARGTSTSTARRRLTLLCPVSHPAPPPPLHSPPPPPLPSSACTIRRRLSTLLRLRHPPPPAPSTAASPPSTAASHPPPQSPCAVEQPSRAWPQVAAVGAAPSAAAPWPQVAAIGAAPSTTAGFFVCRHGHYRAMGHGTALSLTLSVVLGPRAVPFSAVPISASAVPGRPGTFGHRNSGESKDCHKAPCTVQADFRMNGRGALLAVSGPTATAFRALVHPFCPHARASNRFGLL
nr:unnamed protein product [Digitaria exilis]